jgi:HD-like signal output (HDOD) protein
VKKRILFVDDERNILEGLRNRLRHRRQNWDMEFVESAREALDAMERERFDVVVSDLRMPGMDGVALLRRVREAHPAVARIVLSGYADEGAMLRATAIAHQFLPKPSDPGVLESVVARVCDLQALVNDECVRQAVGKIGGLPSPPAVYSRLIASLADESSYPLMLARILKEDGALCTQILHVVNSAYFKHGRSIVSVEEAVVFLGLDTVRQLALAAEVFRQAGAKRSLPEMPLEALQRHALLAGGIASALVSGAGRKETVFIAALLHDIGKVFLSTELPDRVRQVVSEMKTDNSPMCEVENRLFGVTHAEIGAYLLGLWQIPFSVVEAVANHHAPGRAGPQAGLDIVAAVYIADVLANEQLQPAGGDVNLPRAELDAACLEELGVSARLAGWRETAKELARAQSGHAGVL